MQSKSTFVRFRVVGMLCLMCVLLYLDRFCINFAQVFVKEDMGLTDAQVQTMKGAFFWTYALGQVGSGWLSDRFGGRLMLVLYILAWSLFTALVGLAQGFTALILVRLCFGFAQAGAMPTAATLISKWVPINSRGRASSVVGLGARIGGSLAMVMPAYVILFFVPTSENSLLKTEDLLRGNESWSKLVQAKDAEPAKLAATLTTRLSSNGMSTNWTDVAQLVDAINPLLSDSTLIEGLNLKRIKLEREAQRLAALPSRSVEQTQRLNRLVLEACFPDIVRKIYGRGWRPMMLFYAGFGIAIAVAFWMMVRDKPTQHPRCNDAELALIAHGRSEQPAAQAANKLPLKELVMSWSMTCNGAMQFFTNVGWVFVMNDIGTYLYEVHQVPVEDRGWMMFVPTTVAWLGFFFGGTLTDRLTVRFGRRVGRQWLIAGTRMLAGASYLICLFHPSPWIAVAAFSAVALCCDFGIPAVWAFQQDVGGKHTGSVLGWGNMWGNFGAGVGPYIMQFRLGEPGAGGNWNTVFLILAGAFFLSGLSALGIDPNRPLVRDEQPSDA